MSVSVGHRRSVTRLWRAFASIVVHLRLLVIAGWIAAAVAATVWLPGLGSGTPLELGGLIPDDSTSIETGARSARLFSVPLTADTAVVERDAAGLSPTEQTDIVRRAVAATSQSPGGEEIVFALPVLNTLELFPSARESGTTGITFLFFSEQTNLPGKVALAEEYAGRAGDGHFAGVTGPAPARLAQFEEIERSLPIVEAGTTALVALVVGVALRSFGAPLLVLLASGISFLVARAVIPWAGDRLGATVPQEVEPLVVALTLGVVTDYAIFFLAGTRRRLAAGEPRVEAAKRTCANVAPIVATAGFIVVAGSAALLVGTLEFFRAFGPALALTAAVALAVSMTFVPACLAVFGRAVFWPGLSPRDPERLDEKRPSPTREALARFLTSPPVAALVALACIALLVAAATGIGHTRLAFRLASGLPAGTEERVAATEAARGFAAGILAPTVVLVEGDGVADEREALARLQDSLGKAPGVAGVVGPAEQPTEARDIFLAKEGNAARYAVIFEDSPLNSGAIADLDRLDERLPALLREAGLGDARAGTAGQTPIAADTVRAVVESSALVGAVVLAVNFVLLALFLRALVAPLYLLASSLLSVAATLGLTTYFFQDVLGHSDLTYYVPFAAGVLLVSLGSDYNVFVAGRIWQEARVRPLREAVAIAAPRASRAITIAGIALAASFAMLAAVPLDGFREFAFMMGVGVVLETFIVRSLLIPSLVSLFGRASMWPGRIRRELPPTPSGGGAVSSPTTTK